MTRVRLHILRLEILKRSSLTFQTPAQQSNQLSTWTTYSVKH